MTKPTKPAPLVQVCVIGEGGEAIVQVFPEHAILTVRQLELERFAEVTLTPPQLQAVKDAMDQVGTMADEDDLA